MNALLRRCLLLLLLCCPLAQAEMRVIQLQHRMDSDMIQLLQPLLNPWERVAGNGQQLILQADSNRLDELEQLIATFDTPPRRLLISVDDSNSGISHDQGYSAQGRIGGRDGQVILGEHGSRSNQVEIRRYNTTSSDSGTRSVQTLEGSTAFIQTGQHVPQQQWSYDHRGRPVVQTIQRQLHQGFYVTPTLQGDRVTLELSTQNDRFARDNPRIVEQKNVSTRVSGYLNQWIQIGGINQSSQHSSTGILSNNKTYSTENNSLRVKVQLLDD